MGRKSQQIIKKLEKKVFKKLGQDITLIRYNADGDNSELDPYGEPPTDENGNILPSWGNSPNNKPERIVRAVIMDIKLEDEEKSLGGISNQKREMITLYLSQTEDVRLYDCILFPAGSEREYVIEILMPNYLQEDNLIWEAKAFRDSTSR
jgi:hypothetical protein